MGSAVCLLLAFLVFAFFFIYYILYDSFDGIEAALISVGKTVLFAVTGAVAVGFTVLGFHSRTKEIRLQNVLDKKQRDKEIAIAQELQERTEQEYKQFVETSIFDETEGEPVFDFFFHIRYFAIDPTYISAQDLSQRWLPHLKPNTSVEVLSMDDILYKWQPSQDSVGVCAKPDAIFSSVNEYIVVEYKSWDAIDAYKLSHAQLQSIVGAITYALQHSIDISLFKSVLRLNNACFNIYDCTGAVKYYRYYLYLVNSNKEVFSRYYTLKNNLIAAADLSKVIYLGEANDTNDLFVYSQEQQIRGDIHHCKMTSAKTLDDFSADDWNMVD
ncbi:hypothetical protein CW735_00440 [Alteromonas sp. MB-3u-76]|nr:hypothetical protein CW735_00440 [Alteromonas sp. MB-3u-76]